MQFVAKLALIITFWVPLASAQQQPTFRAQTELVVVPAVVTDHSGAHIDGLKKEDFSVRENGAEQKLAVVEEIHSSADRVQRTAARPDSFTNDLTGSRSVHRLTIIALDTINTPILDQARAKSDILKFLSTWASGGEPMSLVVLTRSGVKVIHDFTTDPKVLAEALKRARNRNEQVVDEPTGEAGPEESAVNAEEQQIFQMLAESQENFVAFQRRVAATMTLEAMQQIARSFAGVPGRKSLIWASAGFPFSLSEQTISLNPARDNITDILPMYDRTWQALNNAQIAVYPVDLRGLVTLQPDASIRRPSRNFNQRASWDNSERLATFDTIAKTTGGEAFYNTNDIAGAFRKAADDSSSYYLLAYYRDTKDEKPGWRKLKVTVNRSGTHVRARSGFFVRTAEENATTEEQVRKRDMAMAMASPMNFTGVGIHVTFDKQTAGTGAKKKVVFQINVDPGNIVAIPQDNNHARVDFFAFAETADGQIAGQVGQTIDAHLKPDTLERVQKSGIDYKNVLELAPGEYDIKFIVRDVLSGQIGTVLAPLKVE